MKPWDIWVGYAIGCVVAVAFGFAVGAHFVTAAAEYPQRCYTCGR